ncbi:GAF and ANTAR domain-containing protein [Streptomyces mirabilis]|uniref:GAF and ANTAR domain-containing protein n=1 Tax=Streptomyces mirabilis TaxID=68239 RepID=UPI00357099E6
MDVFAPEFVRQSRPDLGIDEQVRLLELFRLQNDEGPCLECFRTGTPVIVPDLTREIARWPRFVTAARRSGFGAVQALPMLLRDETVGALNLFRATPGPFDLAATPLAQALADVATISLLQQRSSRRSTVLNEQLRTVLNSRVLIEQAKGKLSERQSIDMGQAFTALRGYAVPTTGACPTWPASSSTTPNPSPAWAPDHPGPLPFRAVLDQTAVEFRGHGMDRTGQLGVGLELQLLLDEIVIGLDLLEGSLPVLADHDERRQEDRLQ